MSRMQGKDCTDGVTAYAGIDVCKAWLDVHVAACPPVVEYSAEFRARGAEELELLPEGSAIVEMLADYAVMREQARALGTPG